MPSLLRTCLSAVGILAVGLLLAACTISSDKPLLDDSASTTPLPDSFVFFPYQSHGDGYVRSNDSPATFTRDGNHYVSNIPNSKSPLKVYFAPAGQNYLVGVLTGDEPDMIYGFAHYQAKVLTVFLTPDSNMGRIVARGKANGSLSSSIAYDESTSAVKLDNRADLDDLLAAWALGLLPMSTPMVAYIGTGTADKPPFRLRGTREGWALPTKP